ncbi:MAG: MmgE/PrpD family protein [Burkholderiales bacterium]
MAASTFDMHRTAEIAAFIAGFRYESIPESVRDYARCIIRDGTGALLAAANPNYSTGRLIAEFVQEQGGTPQSSVVGFGFKTSPVMAALANGTMGYACDVEPHHPEAILHPVAVMIPTALALAEPAHASGRDFLAAVVLGCEVEYRVSMALGPAALYALGFHPSAVAGCFGATAAAAFLAKLDPAQTIRALGLAACQASGMMAWESDPTENARPFQMGVAARNGVTAALLAKRGFGGPDAVFDTGHTVFHAFSRNPRPELLTKDLGMKFDGVSELAIKPYSCVSFLHPGLDALFDLLREQRIAASDIKRLTLYFPQAGQHCIDGNPLKSHCAQYILPVAAVAGALRVADIFVDQRIANPAVAALAKRVEIRNDPVLDELFPDFYATIVEIETNDGSIHRKRNDIARGYPENPLSATELAAKFRQLAGSVATPDRVDALSALLDRLDALDDVAALADALRTPARAMA